MNFDSFCAAHGLIVGRLEQGRWVRVPTTDKPKGRNGAYKFLGTIGWVQNWAAQTEPSVWRNESDSIVAHKDVQRIAKEAAAETARDNAKAASRAAWILGQCNTQPHAYFAAKGFPDEPVNVWATDTGLLAVIPMRINGKVVGCQMIDEVGGKKFLSGQRTGRAEFVFENRGPHVLCEGYATALSTRHAFKNLKRSYTLHVCFSAGNLLKVAANLSSGFVIADNDESGTGQRVAREIGWPFWISDRVGEDANDYAARCGLFALSQGLNKTMRERIAA